MSDSSARLTAPGRAMLAAGRIDLSDEAKAVLDPDSSAQAFIDALLLAELPADCPFCLAGTVDWSRMVEVSLAKPVAWHDEPVILAGRLEVVHNDPDGVVYRLHAARLLP